MSDEPKRCCKCGVAFTGDVQSLQMATGTKVTGWFCRVCRACFEAAVEAICGAKRKRGESTT